MAVPEVPATFTKFPASLGGPFDDIEIVGDTVDWEVELVAVIGARADRVAEADAWASGDLTPAESRASSGKHDWDVELLHSWERSPSDRRRFGRS